MIGSSYDSIPISRSQKDRSLLQVSLDHSDIRIGVFFSARLASYCAFPLTMYHGTRVSESPFTRKSINIGILPMFPSVSVSPSENFFGSSTDKDHSLGV